MTRLVLLVLLALLSTGCAPRCHVRQVQWFDFEQGITTERTVSMTVCDGGIQLRWK